MKATTFILLITALLFGACNKRSYPAQTSDALVKSVKQLLTQKTWKADEVRVQQSNDINQFYKRGGLANTTDYDSDSLKFNSNNTGVYYYEGIATPITWKFINSEKTKIKIIIYYSPYPLTINWEYMNITETSLTYTQYVTAGISYLASGTRTPN